MPNNYIEQFYSLRCHQDVLDILGKIPNRTKEITESMAVLKRLSRLDHEKYHLIDLCAGNALTSVLAAFMYKFKSVTAYDINKRKYNYEAVRNFQYIEYDINNFYSFDWLHNHSDAGVVIISIHPCKDLAYLIVDIFEFLKFHLEAEYGKTSHMVIMPCCCSPKHYIYSNSFKKGIGDYKLYCLEILNSRFLPGENTKIIEDEFIMSPKNVLISTI